MDTEEEERLGSKIVTFSGLALLAVIILLARSCSEEKEPVKHERWKPPISAYDWSRQRSGESDVDFIIRMENEAANHGKTFNIQYNEPETVEEYIEAYTKYPADAIIEELYQ